MLQKKYFIAMVAIILLTAGLRLPGALHGILNGDFAFPDEIGHAEIAKHFIAKLNPALVTFNPDYSNGISVPENTRAFGFQVSAAAYLIKVAGIHVNFDDLSLILIGRILSIFYSVLSVIMVYVVASLMLGDRRAGILSALILAVSDLNVIYSSFAVPEAGHAFWSFFSIAALLFYAENRHNKLIKICLGIGIGMSIAFKFDFAPAILFAFLLLLQFRHDYKIIFRDLTFVWAISILVLFLSWATADLTDFLNVFAFQAKSTRCGLKNDNSLLFNPILMLSAIISGTSLPAFTAALIGFYKNLKNNEKKIRRPVVLMGLAFLLLFFIYWIGGPMFERRSFVFTPYIAVLSGLSIAGIYSRRLRSIVTASVIGYTLILCVLSQYAVFDDPRYEAAKYLENNRAYFGKTLIAYPSFSTLIVKNFQNKIFIAAIADQESYKDPAFGNYRALYENADFLVMHEAFYKRYSDKNFTTPFRNPRNCDDVAVCNPMLFTFIHDVLFEKGRYKLIKKFAREHPLPERLLFKTFFGTYIPYARGDVLIYARKDVLGYP